MKSKRLLAFGIVCLALFSGIQLRIFALILAGEGTQPQNQATLQLEAGRADIYDCNMNPLTGVETETLALALPGDQSYEKLYRSLSPASARKLYAQQLTGPALVSVDNASLLPGIYTYTRPVRYFETPIAAHLLGYLDGDGKGAAGLEKAYESLLSQGGTKKQLLCTLTAAGGLVKDSEPVVSKSAGTGLGLQLTLDEQVQRICEAAAGQLSSGAIVALDVSTGQVKALVSTPGFDPDNVGQSIAANDSSLLCRPLKAYNVGSVFKPLVAVAALESGISMDESYFCTGSITVADHEYHCASNHAHGEVDMAKALEQSCNCYFIDLAQKVGAEQLLKTASLCGFGRAVTLWKGGACAAGNLPTEEELSVPGELASLGFGQGKLLASPIQLAAFYNAIANGGIYIAPTVVMGSVDVNTGELTGDQMTQETLRVMSETTAKRMRVMLAGVVTDGLATAAAPEYKTAAGKTGTAQTGRMNKDGVEELDAWFAGFYPATAPQYTIVILEDSTTRNGEKLTPIFAQICNDLERLEKWG